MKKLLVLLALGAVLFVPVSNSFAYPVVVGEYIYITDAGGTTTGGPFTVWDWYSDTKLFDTFCVETSEQITLNKSASYAYKVANISNIALYGSVGSAGDPLSFDTAYLYKTWISGGLFSPKYDDPKLNDLQRAIWYIEQEVGGVNNYLVGVAANKWSDIGDVRVMNLEKWAFSAKGSPNWTYVQRAQDLLTVPEPATLLLLGFGLIGLTMVGGRRFIK